MAKYGNKKTTLNGMTFDSKKEARRYSELLLLERAGAIHNLQTQVKYVLIPSQRDPVTGKVIERECAYKADFVYTENGETVVEDMKGFRTKDYIIKRKLMLKVHGIRIREV
nr:MAG TPA: Endonuclease [Caudoviricetes sp.]